MDLELKLEIVMPFLGKYRPFVGRCCQKCTPKSWESFFHKQLTSLGFCNVIKITEENTRYRGWLVRRLCHFLTVCDWKLCAESTNDLQQRIFHNQRVQDVVSQKMPQGKGDAPVASMSVEQWMREVHRILCQIQASLSPFLLRLSHWALLKLLNWMFLSVILHKGQLEMVRRAAQVYVEELLHSKQPLLIFLEEAFSGAQKLSVSSREWLSLVVSVFHAGTFPDIMMVPLGISYDAAPDLIHRGQMEYITNNFFRQSCSEKCLEELLLPEVLDKCPTMLDSEKLERCSSGSRGIIALNVEQQTLVDSLSLHSLSASVSCSAIMAAEIMSSLLLYKHQEGVFLSRLMQDFVWLTEEILLRNYDVGFSGRVRDVVLHALSLLRHCISLHHLSLGDVLVSPKRTEAAVLELSQHSAALLPVFLPEAIGACAVNALLVELLPYLGSPEQLRDVVLVQEELHNKTLLLIQLLPRSFLLCKPCQSVNYYCQIVMDKLIQCGLLVAEEVPSDFSVCDTARKRFTKKLLWKVADDFGDSDSDYGEEAEKHCFKISQLESDCSLFVFLCCLLSPLLKTLARAAGFLGALECPQPESECLEKLHQFLLRKAKEDYSFECANWTLTTLSVHICKDLGVLREVGGQGEPILHLSETFNSKDNQDKLVKCIRQFIYN